MLIKDDSVINAWQSPPQVSPPASPSQLVGSQFSSLPLLEATIVYSVLSATLTYPTNADNTNADLATRACWVALACKLAIPIRCVYLQTPAEVCRHNATVRALNDPVLFNPEKREMLPGMAFTGYQSRFVEPSVEEGFADVVVIPFVVSSRMGNFVGFVLCCYGM